MYVCVYVREWVYFKLNEDSNRIKKAYIESDTIEIPKPHVQPNLDLDGTQIFPIQLPWGCTLSCQRSITEC